MKGKWLSTFQIIGRSHNGNIPKGIQYESILIADDDDLGNLLSKRVAIIGECQSDFYQSNMIARAAFIGSRYRFSNIPC